MNKDVIYIEPEDDITDILANIKEAKNKIIALVPPKKASVLQSAINFKLIAKTATQYEKTVVLITSDESLLTLADRVKMPTAKSLQSKPKLPAMDDTSEFGDDEGEDVVSEDSKDEVESEEPEEKNTEKKTASSKKKDEKKSTSTKATSSRNVDIELDSDDVEKDSDRAKVSKDAKKNPKVPNFKKYRKFVIVGAILVVALTGFLYWANVIAPKAKISVKVKTTASNFNQTIKFVADDSKSDPENGVFYVDQKTTTKQSSADFQATGEVDKGTKASGSITIVRPKNEIVSCDGDSNYSIPANTVVTISGKQFIVTEGGSANAKDSQIGHISGKGTNEVCGLKESISSGKISVVAKEVGDSYNIAASNSGISLSISTGKNYTITSTAMTGGVSKVVKVVSKEDIERAESDLSGESDSEIREELTGQFGNEYILISSSFTAESSKSTTSPSINEEVGDGVTPKIVRETKYTIYAVRRQDINDYIKAIAESKISDSTQTLYSTGVAIDDGDEDKAFFESYKNENGNMTAKLKSTTKTGPRITEDMVKEVALGEKVGRVQSNLRSYNGVTDATVKTSYFWVTSVPKDDNKVEIEITVE